MTLPVYWPNLANLGYFIEKKENNSTYLLYGVAVGIKWVDVHAAPRAVLGAEGVADDRSSR